MKDDLLYQMLQKFMNQQKLKASALRISHQRSRVHQFGPESHGKEHESLVRAVAADYFDYLLGQGHIPFEMITVVLEDLEEEVLEMYRKKTYGHYSLDSFLKAPKAKRRQTS